MRIGLQVPNFTWPGGPPAIAGQLAQIARVADDVGFYSLWVMDHFFQISMVGPRENDMLECYSTLGYLAALTKRVQLGPMVTGVIYRYPGILVKTATTVDVLSGGRTYFGIGAAWNEDEAKSLGAPFPSLGTRFELLEDALRIAKQMWSGDAGPFQGQHAHLGATLCSPQPLARPHPPILVAGNGEKKTLRLVAQYGDACNLYGSPQVVTDKLAILRRHCETLGRDFDSIEKTTLATVDLRPGKQSSVGVQHAIFNIPNVHEMKPLETFGREIIPAVARL
jgi:F420-dependent oxidoreductase-like protein